MKRDHDPDNDSTLPVCPPVQRTNVGIHSAIIHTRTQHSVQRRYENQTRKSKPLNPSSYLLPFWRLVSSWLFLVPGWNLFLTPSRVCLCFFDRVSHWFLISVSDWLKVYFPFFWKWKKNSFLNLSRYMISFCSSPALLSSPLLCSPGTHLAIPQSVNHLCAYHTTIILITLPSLASHCTIICSKQLCPPRGDTVSAQKYA